jgi:microcystin-dependent protein
MEYVKPDVNKVFAATGSIIEPSAVKVNLGWVSEIPDFEFENWIQNRQDAFIAHINQVGVVTWDATTEYRIGKSYIQSTDGIIYKALTTNTNSLPQSNALDWKLAFNESGFSYSKAESDTLFAVRSNNLSDLTSSGAARTNLSVYSKSESDGKYQLASELVGMTSAFPTTTAPSGWLACNGTAVNRITYVALFNRIGITSGAGDGSTTFNLPDLRGEFIRGFDDGRGVDTGRTVASSQGDEIRSHNHTASSTSAGSHAHSASTDAQGNHNHSGVTSVAGSHNHTVNGHIPLGRSGGDAIFDAVSRDARVDDAGYFNMDQAGNHAHGLSINFAGSHNHTVFVSLAGEHNHPISVAATGGSETRPRNVALLYCIKY